VPEQVTSRDDDKPTILNRGMVVGYLLFKIPGALIGGLLGKERMEHEAQEVRQKDTPGILNQEAAIGGVLGVCLGIAVALLAVTLVPSIAGTALAARISAIAVAGTGLTGLALGYSWGKHCQEQSHVSALQKRNVESKGHTPPLVVNIAVPDGTQVEQSPSGDFTLRIESERGQAAAPQHTGH
jgi:hypothetical protein